MGKRKAIIVDGNSLLFRSFHATYFGDPSKILRSKKGIPTNAVYVFHNYIENFKKNLTSNDRLIVTFDTGKKTFRSEEFEQYKAQRKPVPEELIVQFPIVREMLDDMNIFRIEVEGYEGDDLAGSFAKKLSEMNEEVIVYTSDKDFLQLVDENISVYLIKNKNEIQINNINNIFENQQLYPSQIIDFKAIAGDSSDNYKGVPGIGEKTVIPLLQKYQTIENIYNNLDQLTKGQREKFITYKDDCYKCRQLATIVTDINVDEYLDKTFVKPVNKLKLLRFYNEYSLEKYANKLDKQVIQKSKEDINLEKNDKSQVQSLFQELNDKIENKRLLNTTYKLVNFEFEKPIVVESLSSINMSVDTIGIIATTKNENLCDAVGVVFANKLNTYYIKIRDVLRDREQFNNFVLKNKIVSTYDNKFLQVVLNRLGLNPIETIEFDYVLANYIVDPESVLTKEFLVDSYNLEKEEMTDLTFESFVCQAISNLKDFVLSKLESLNMLSLYKNIELKLSYVLAKMEITGFPCDKGVFSEISFEYQELLNKIKDKILGYTENKQLNLNSPKQVKEFLFNELKIGAKLKNKGTGIEVLTKLKDEHPVVNLLIEYRLFNKIITTYLESLPNHVQKDGRIHALFNQALTQTGRLSMSEPNLQNISVRSEEGKVIRKAFKVSEGYKFASFDYSQIELRVLAAVANIPHLLEVFNNDEDIHRATASLVHNIPLEEVTLLMRRQAKAVNFGIIYGITIHGLSEDLGISYSEAKEFVDNFNKTFPGISKFQENVIKEARKNGYVKTLLNRVRYLKNINDSNFQIRSFSERAAVNTIIQGTAADLIKIAMVEIAKMLENYKTKMVLQIHDELIFIIPDEELDEIIPKIKNIMEHCYDLKCKLVAEYGIASNWYDLK